MCGWMPFMTASNGVTGRHLFLHPLAHFWGKRCCCLFVDSSVPLLGKSADRKVFLAKLCMQTSYLFSIGADIYAMEKVPLLSLIRFLTSVQFDKRLHRPTSNFLAANRFIRSRPHLIHGFLDSFQTASRSF